MTKRDGRDARSGKMTDTERLGLCRELLPGIRAFIIAGRRDNTLPQVLQRDDALLQIANLEMLLIIIDGQLVPPRIRKRLTRQVINVCDALVRILDEHWRGRVLQ